MLEAITLICGTEAQRNFAHSALPNAPVLSDARDARKTQARTRRSRPATQRPAIPPMARVERRSSWLCGPRRGGVR
jgi:hypothetical protein